MRSARTLWLLTAALALWAPPPVFAYVGPGVGLTAIGTALAFLAAIVLAIAGFIWYPIKRLWRSRARRQADTTNAPR